MDSPLVVDPFLPPPRTHNRGPFSPLPSDFGNTNAILERDVGPKVSDGRVRLNLVTVAFPRTAEKTRSGKDLSGTISDIMHPVCFLGSQRVMVTRRMVR